jgi:[acyl-carrier-protein] S-malonyltransferase
VETVRGFADQGIGTLAECGPGKVLAGLNKRIDGNMRAFALSDEAALRQAMETLRIGENN